MTQFSSLELKDGKLVESKVRVIAQRDLLKCPHVILMADHYRADGSCRCDDESHSEMAEWGYVWQDGQWQSKEDDDG